MFPFFTVDSMSMNAVIAASKTMLKVAHTDGVHPDEIALIKGFYSSCVNSSEWPAFDKLQQESSGEWPAFDKLQQESSGDFHVDAKAFSSDQEREMIVALSIMTGFADGAFSAAEQAVVRTIATELHIAPARFDEINSAVKDHMLAQLSHLPDAGSVAKVAKELG
jgi:tellurite resistance protein